MKTHDQYRYFKSYQNTPFDMNAYNFSGVYQILPDFFENTANAQKNRYVFNV